MPKRRRIMGLPPALFSREKQGKIQDKIGFFIHRFLFRSIRACILSVKTQKGVRRKDEIKKPIA